MLWHAKVESTSSQCEKKPGEVEVNARGEAFCSAGKSAREACGWLGWSAALTPVFAYFEHWLIESAARGGSVALPLCVTTVILLVCLTASIATAIWLYRASSNIRWLTAVEPNLSPRDAVITWFVPVFNLFCPYFALRDLWASGDLKDLPTENRHSSELSTVGVAWSFLVLATIVSAMGATYAMSSTATFHPLVYAGHGLEVMGTLFLIRTIQVTTRRQDRRFEQMTEAMQAQGSDFFDANNQPRPELIGLLRSRAAVSEIAELDGLLASVVESEPARFPGESGA